MFIKEKNSTFNPSFQNVKLLELLLTLFNEKIFRRMIILNHRLIFILFCVSSGFLSFAQQNTLLTHYMFTNMAFNPGYAGSGEGISATGLVRQQWIGFKADDGSSVAPQTYLLTIDSPIKFLHGALSGYISQDKIAQFSTINFKIGYAYRAELGSGKLGAGLMVDFVNTKIDFSKFTPTQEGDPALSEKSKQSDFVIDLSAGLYYTVPDKFYLGFSADQLLQTKGPLTHYQLRRHYYLTGGYYYVIPEHPAFELQPSALFLYDGAVFQFNLSTLLEYNNKIWGGVEYRFQDAVAILAGMSFKSFRIGISYDIATSSMTHYSYGGVEVMLNYCFKIKTEKFRKSYKNTRFL
jgi:type IX secretion system PorP/SprF family membrane protein